MARRTLCRLAALLPLALSCVFAQGLARADELPVTSASPPDGASLAAFPNPYPQDVVFTITSPIINLSAKVNIASENAVNGIGRLSPEVTIQSVYLKEGEGAEMYSGYSAFEEWATKPGTYYWQVEGSRYEETPTCQDCPCSIRPSSCTPNPPWLPT